MSVTTPEQERQSAFAVLKNAFDQYGLGSLVGSIQSLMQEGISPEEYTLRLRQLPEYKQRFSANLDRVKAGLTALPEAQYVALEDQYQNLMRQYGLPKSFYEKDATGVQSELNKLIVGDVSPAELEDRIQTAVNRVKNASPEVLSTLNAYYPGIANNQGALYAYVLNPEKALPEIKRQVQAAEIGAASQLPGVEQIGLNRALQLAGSGVTQQQAQQGYQAISGGLQRGTELANIYGQQPYTQSQAEAELFGLSGGAQAEQQRKKLASQERATFGGTSQAAAGGALGRERAGGF